MTLEDLAAAIESPSKFSAGIIELLNQKAAQAVDSTKTEIAAGEIEVTAQDDNNAET